MEAPKICLTLTCESIAEDLDLVNKYRSYIDMAELRVDFLKQDERLYVRRFPQLAGLPCVLTIRRAAEGGRFVEGESARTVLFARALSFAEDDRSKNFAYVDFEEDFHVSSLEDATHSFETRIIRSFHDMTNPVTQVRKKLKDLCTSGFEIPKIAFMPKSLSDVTNLFDEARHLRAGGQILLAMGNIGLSTRILGYQLKNFLTYTSAPETLGNVSNIAQLDAVKLDDLYRVRSIAESTKIYGVTGWPLTLTSSPELHNRGYCRHNINAVYIPIPAEDFSEALEFAQKVGVQGLSVTVPHKEAALAKANVIDSAALEIGSCNTLLRKGDQWQAFNTDWDGFLRALLEFTGLKHLKGKRVSIIGAGGAAKAVAYAVAKSGGRACVFNRTLSKAKALAAHYKFKFAPLSSEVVPLIKKYSDIIVQTTSKGMGSSEPPSDENDPLYFYDFQGSETVFDIVYEPKTTAIMARAKAAGCKVSNGFSMLLYQGYKQFQLYTGVEY